MNLFQYIDRSQSKIVKDLQSMVRCPTVNPPGDDYQTMAEGLADRCRRIGMTARVYRVPDADTIAASVDPQYPRYNVVARLDAGADRTVHFNAHYDVVPVAEDDWNDPPFAARTHGQWLYGRGAGDMKGSIASLLAAIEALGATRTAPALNIECSFTADEETGGALGAGWVVEQGLVKADCAIVCEGSSGPRVGLGHNGVLWLQVSVLGKSAHASSPDRGINAFEHMALIVSRLQDAKRRLSGRSRRWRDPAGSERFPTISLGGVFGGGQGQKVNTVPGAASFSIDRRLVPDERIAVTRAELTEAIDAAATAVGARIQIDTLLAIEPCVTAIEEPLAQAFAETVRSVRRRAPGFRVTTGFTDLHYFVDDGGLPGIGYGVAGERAHGADERVSIRDLILTAKTYADFLRRGIDV
ncbi:MAG: ArgE/DapE family deacylase [Gemmatimonadetes bacterium]|jgi:succinyl-diaminopimelate desuccinylase|nr:ArgE/DapE family deacylase [Gemmatimonadota bacterium]MBT7864698.1 ArgE/DapE family deacylase [Gemmatimonadota bacterium]